MEIFRVILTPEAQPPYSVTIRTNDALAVLRTGFEYKGVAYAPQQIVKMIKES